MALHRGAFMAQGMLYICFLTCLAAVFTQQLDEAARFFAGPACTIRLDTLAKTFLTCVPEPPADAKAEAVARAKERHDRLLKSAGRAMVGESKLAT